MQITEHAGQAPRLPGMDPATAGARAPLDSRADRPAARPSDNVRQERTERPASRTKPMPVRYGAGF
jgi:hypothetical protein